MSNIEHKRKPDCNERQATYEFLRPLLERLRSYDSVLERLSKEGGGIDDIDTLMKLLNGQVAMEDFQGRRRTFKLTEYDELQRQLSRTSNHSAFFDVRVLPSGMPSYYICRVESDFWARCIFVVEDIYKSPKYSLFDERFCRLMVYGRESRILRLSHLRDGVVHAFGKSGSLNWQEADSILHRAGAHVLRLAWHGDQLPGVLTARHFGLRNFRNAFELLYLCLSCDVCELRTNIDEPMLKFFEAVYPQPAISSFLGSLGELRGTELNDISRKAIEHYVLLSREYETFLSTQVKWEADRPSRPLFKLLFGNFWRLECLADLARSNPNLAEASRRLESSSGMIINDITGADASLAA
jgi:hypothetical protein